MSLRIRIWICSVFIIALFLPAFAFGQENGDQQIQQADALFEANRFSQARSLYQRYISLNPEGAQLAQARYRLAECYLDDSGMDEKGRFNKAINEFEKAVSSFPDDARAPLALYKMAVCYIRIGFVQDAVIQLRRARESYPEAENSEDILLLLAESYMNLEDFSQAGIYYTTLLQSYPTSSFRKASLRGLIISFHKQSSYANLDQAIRLYRQIAPGELETDAELRFIWCESLFFTKKYDEAEKQLNALLKQPEAFPLLPHIRIRLGDLMAARAATMADAKTGKLEYQKAIDEYKLVLGLNAPEKIRESTLIRIIEISDIIGSDVADYGLGDAESILKQIFEKNQDPDYRALILSRLARHNRAKGRDHIALQYYARISQDFLEASLYDYLNSEFHGYVRSLMKAALARGNRSEQVDYYLGFGDGLELDQKERLELGRSLASVELFEKAEGMFAELLREGVNETQQRAISLEMMKIHFKRKDFAKARAEMANVLSMSPTFEEKEQTLLMKQEMLFIEKKLGEMQSYFLEQTPVFDTPALRYSILHKLGTLYFINGQSEESISYFKRFFDEFGQGIKGDAVLYDNIKTATISLADLYYQKSDYRRALQLYERYIFRFGGEGDIAWPLKQMGMCYSYLGKNRLAAEILAEFVADYPEHYLKRQAEKDLAEIRKKLPEGKE